MGRFPLSPNRASCDEGDKGFLGTHKAQHQAQHQGQIAHNGICPAPDNVLCFIWGKILLATLAPIVYNGTMISKHRPPR